MESTKTDKLIDKEQLIKETLDLFPVARKNYQYYFNANRFFIKCSDGTEMTISFGDLDLYKILGFNKKDITRALYSHSHDQKEDSLFYLERLFYKEAVENILSNKSYNMPLNGLVEKMAYLSKTNGFNGDNILGILEFNKSLYHLTGNDIKDPSDYYLLMLDNTHNLFLMGLKKKNRENNQIACEVDTVMTSFDYNAMFYLQKVVLPVYMNCADYKNNIYDIKLHPVVIDKNMQRLSSVAHFFGMHLDSGYYCSKVQGDLTDMAEERRDLKKEVALLTAQNAQLKEELQSPPPGLVKRLFNRNKSE
jgi:hypothetical protein